jgi:hypothetical protein
MQCGTRFPTMSRHQNNPFYTWFLFHFTSRMSNSPLSPSPAGFPPTTLTPCPTPPSSVFSRLSQPKTVAKQLEEAAVGALPPNPTIENLPKITWKNRRFVQEDLLARKGAKGRKSWIRSHGTFLVELNYQDLPIGHVWCCNRCDMRGAAEFFSVQATSSAADHLRKSVLIPFNLIDKISSS